MDKAEFKRFHDERWFELDSKLKHKAVAVLTDELDASTFSQIVLLHNVDPVHWIGLNHHGWGTGIRNLLREKVALDDALPTGNWDDYYVQAIEAAAGLRP